MPFCHFSKVYKGTSWDELKANKLLQVARNCRELEYSELVTITVEQAEFDQMCNDVSCMRPCYRKYANQSLASLDGKWKCIVIDNEKSKQRIILYTAGRMYPLYAAVCE